MGALETNTTLIYGVHVRESANDGSDFTNAAADYRILFLGEDGLLHVKDSSGTVTNPFSGGAPTVTTVDAPASGDTTIVNTATWYDAAGVSASFADGVWIIGGQCTVGPIVTTNQSYDWSVRIWDGTTTHIEAQRGIGITANQNGENFTIPLGPRVITLAGGPTTLKISASCLRGSSASSIKRNIGLNSATTNAATRLFGYKVT